MREDFKSQRNKEHDKKVTASTNMGSWGLTETDPLTRELAYDSTRPTAHMLQGVLWSSF